MRLSVVIPSFYPAVKYGGPIYATLNLSEALAVLGIDVYVSTTNAHVDQKLDVIPNKFIAMQKHFSVKYYNETRINRFSLSLLLNLWKDILAADLVHIQSIFSVSTPIALLYSRLFGKKILLSPRGSLCEWCLKERESFKRGWIKWFIRPFVGSVVWHVTSEKEADEVKILFTGAQTVLITDGINLNEFSNPKRFTKNEYVKKFTSLDLQVSHTIISLGRLHKVKGFDILIEAFSLLVQEDSDAVLMIAGNDEGERDNLVRQIAAKGLEKRVFLIGPIYGEDKVTFLANADLFVMPSHTENFGIAFAESLAAGTPGIASNQTPWEGIEEAGCGKWVANEQDSIVNAMRYILQQDKATMSANAISFVSQYDWSKIAYEFYKLFRKMSDK
ncbi:hypothetical protein B649_08420 [Candidatus Sulfuricurvum sp. RIFRC-1]|uniref:glycosyltransferase n=1 Tax=Candidatus Sulfuricurvum sp. RIFRC-1 TaxID=1249480 RepID=UPI0002998D77|nr:glycosyltransferase [Candidatus Sulfuricurvum sp. RIFRC-1]AFV97996.1 hypothetical protein B649_08420 [Candidatus Sulfuricurvum sp. RIFRC-1]